MATYLLLPGSGGDAFYWSRAARLLREAGHEAIAVDLPADDDGAGLAEYADTAVAALAGHDVPADGIVLLAQSFSGFIAPLVSARVPVAMLVLLNAMVPKVDESPAQWWDATGHGEAIRSQCEHAWDWPEFDPTTVFLHDVPPEVVAEMTARGERGQSDTPFEKPWPPAGYEPNWPDVPTRFLQARDDRFFPLEFQRRVVGERLGIPVNSMAGGHLVALSRPAELVDRLEAYRAEL